MAIDFSALSTDTVEIPETAKRRVVEYTRTPVDDWFSGGITPEGKGYSVPATAPEDRKELVATLNRAALHYNSEVRKPGDQPLSYRQNVTRGGVIVAIVPKSAKPRKAETPKESDKSGAPVVKGSGNGTTTARKPANASA